MDIENFDIKGLSLSEPWAHLVALSEKMIETRGFKPKTMPKFIAIQAAKKVPDIGLGLMRSNNFFYETLKKHGYQAGTLKSQVKDSLGHIIAVVQTKAVFSTDEFCNLPLTDKELAFGDYSAKRWGWMFSKVWKLEKPIPCKGMLSLFTISDAIKAEILEQLKWEN